MVGLKYLEPSQNTLNKGVGIFQGNEDEQIRATL